MTSGGALETSITLDDVFTVVQAKRVPLAPELAGYLALEIAEGADAGCDVDPRTVFIGEEGTVGLVRPKSASGNAEASIRALLARLLDVSGSQTPALASASKRRPGTGLPSLVEELEAALIPVNRAAGRRALARLAREVKRVTLGVGRNASIPASQEVRPVRGSSPSHHDGTSPALPGRGPHQIVNPPPSTREPEPEPEKPAPRSVRPPTPPASFGGEEENPTRATRDSLIPPQVLSDAPPAAPPVHDASEMPTRVMESKRPPAASQPDSVDQLIASFEVSKKSDVQVARELKAMIGLDPTPPPPTASNGDGDVEALLSMSETSAPLPPPPPKRASAASIPDAAAHASAPAPAPAPMPEPVSARDFDERQLPTGPSKIAPRRSKSLDEPQRSGSNALLVVMIALFVVAAGAIALWRLKPGILSGRTKEKVEAERAQAEADRQKMLLAAQTASCKATLVVSDVPSNAEVLLRVGQAPVDVERMPVGTRLEFVATAESYAPKRAVVQAGAPWETKDGKTRFELAVQLDKSKAKPGQVDLWPTAEPGSEVGGKGPPGTVHVVSTPRGAEVWLLAGIGPEAKIEALRCDADVDVLVAGPTTLRKRLHVAAADFVSDGAAKVARVSAK
jgi:hypothetical protein